MLDARIIQRSPITVFSPILTGAKSPIYLKKKINKVNQLNNFTKNNKPLMIEPYQTDDPLPISTFPTTVEDGEMKTWLAIGGNGSLFRVKTLLWSGTN